MSSDSRLETYRRAGRAIAVLNWGGGIEDATVETNGGIWDEADDDPFAEDFVVAKSRSEAEAADDPRTSSKRELQLLLAGSIAERRATPNRDNSASEEELQKRAQELVWHVIGGWDDPAVKTVTPSVRVDAFLAPLRLQAEILIDRHWRQVVALAVALQQYQHLNTHQVRKILSGLLVPARDQV